MIRLFHLLCCVLLISPAAAYAAPTPSAPATTPKDGTVYQVSEAALPKLILALNNARNMQEALGRDNVEIEVVFYGPGVETLKSGSLGADRVAEALASGIRLSVCQNSMRGLRLAPSDMLPNLEYVPSGVVRIMQRQKSGWAYIRP